VARRCVWSRNINNEEAVARVGSQSPKKLCSPPNFLFKLLILRFRTLFSPSFYTFDLILNSAIWDSSVWPHDITGTLLFLYSAWCEPLFHHFDCIFAFLNIMAGTCVELSSMLRIVLMLCFTWLSWPSLVRRYEVSYSKKVQFRLCATQCVGSMFLRNAGNSLPEHIVS